MKKNNRLKVISFILFVLLLTVAFSFAYFTANLTGVETSSTIIVGAGTMDIAYDGGPNISSSNIYPKSDAWVTKTFTVTGNNTTDMLMGYSLVLIIEDNTFSHNSLSYTLESINTNSNGEVITEINQNEGLNSGHSVNHLGNGYFSKTGGAKIHTYTLKIYFLDTRKNQNIDQGKTFNGYVNITGVECVDCLQDNIIASSGGEEFINENGVPNFGIVTPGNPIGYREKTPVEVSNVGFAIYEILMSSSYVYGTNNYQLQNHTTEYAYNFTSADIGKYICDINDYYYNLYDFGINGCNSIYKVLDTANGKITKAMKYDVEFLYNLSQSKMYAAEDDYGTSYYYRGGVENNYLVFANMCFRIVRIVGDGSIKLVLYNNNENQVSNPCDKSEDSSQAAFSSYGVFNTNDIDNKYVGYMFGGTASSASTSRANAIENTTSSAIKTNLETWYNDKLETYSAYIADTLWCNDRKLITGTGFGKNPTQYGTYQRFQLSNAPTLKCSDKNDSFTHSDTKMGNAKLAKPIGLLTADEATFAGGVNYVRNQSYYLYNNAKNYLWWTMSAYEFNGNTAFMFAVNGETGEIFNDTANSSNAIRPSIALKSNTKILGRGTSTNPYTLK